MKTKVSTLVFMTSFWTTSFIYLTESIVCCKMCRKLVKNKQNKKTNKETSKETHTKIAKLNRHIYNIIMYIIK